MEDIDELVDEARVIHPTHYAVFWALEATAKRLSGDSTRSKNNRRVAAAAEEAWSKVVAAVEEALPALHHEKVVYFDALAQARVVAGDIKVGIPFALWRTFSLVFGGRMKRYSGFQVGGRGQHSRNGNTWKAAAQHYGNHVSCTPSAASFLAILVIRKELLRSFKR